MHNVDFLWQKDFLIQITFAIKEKLKEGGRSLKSCVSRLCKKSKSLHIRTKIVEWN